MYQLIEYKTIDTLMQITINLNCKCLFNMNRKFTATIYYFITTRFPMQINSTTANTIKKFTSIIIVHDGIN